MVGLYVFGSGDCGQLGLGEDVDIGETPLRINVFDDKHVIDVKAGGLHSMALSKEGVVYSWGCNDDKALGHDSNEWTIGRVSHLPKNIIQIACGDSISCALTDKGEVYAWGTFRDSKGILGFGFNAKTLAEIGDVPKHIEHLPRVVQVSAGSNHVVVVSENNEVYGWGCGEQGQLGRRVVERLRTHMLMPRKIIFGKGKQSPKISKIVCGSYHTLALTTEGHVYSWGLNNHGQLGHGDEANRILPEKISTDIRFVDLAAGEHHSLGLTEGGTVYCWGRGDSGQLGAELELSLVPIPIPQSYFQGHRIVRIGCGGNHCLASDEKNNIYGWGFGEMFQLGNGSDSNENKPTKITFEHGSVVVLDGGGQHSLVLCAEE